MQNVNIHQRTDENFFPFIQNITRPNILFTCVSTHHTLHSHNNKTWSHFDTRGVTLHGRRTHRQTEAVHVHLKSPHSTITAAVKHDKVQTLNFLQN